MASASVELLSVCLAIDFAISHLPRSGPIPKPAPALSVVLTLWALRHVRFPAVSAAKPAVEEEVALLAWNLEAGVTETCSLNNGLLTFAADDRCPEFHRSRPSFACASLKAARPIASRDPYRLSVDERARAAREEQFNDPTLRVLGSALPATTTQFLLVVAEEEVVCGIGHENLPAHVAGHKAAGRRSGSAGRVKALDESSFA